MSRKILLIIQFSQKNGSLMKAEIVDLNEVRCNFCFNWISGKNLVKNRLNSCTPCLTQYLNNKGVLYDQQGNLYVFILSSSEQFCKIQAEQELSINCDKEKRATSSMMKDQSNLNSKIQQNTAKSSGSIIFNVNLNQIENDELENTENIQDLIIGQNKTITKSHCFERDNILRQKNHQSLIFNTPFKSKTNDEYFTVNKMCRLQDFGRSLDKTRFLQKYQYYFDTQVIEEFMHQHPKIEHKQNSIKEFWNDENSNDDDDRSISIKSKTINSKSHRSALSNNSSLKNQKLNQEEVKTKITSFLETKYSSESLTRIMATYLKEAYERTTLQNMTLQLTNYKISTIDLSCYLNMFNFQSIFIIKLINVGLTDEQIPIIANFIWSKPVQCLVLTGNKLTEGCLNVFLSKSMPNLKELYLGNNRISKTKFKQNIAELHTKYILYL